VVGAIPNVAFNWWAFGAPFHTVYEDYWREHPGLRSALGPYAIHPNIHTFNEMLFSSLGLFTVAPVLLLGFVGLVLMARRNHLAEALVVAGVCAIVIVYQAGLGAFGGLGPPRYLITLVPYLGLPLARTLRTLPLTTIALAAVSIFQTTVQDATGPLAAYDGQWLLRARERVFMLNAANVVGVTGWYTIAAFFAAVAAALGCAYVASRPLRVDAREWPWVVLGIGVWAVIALRASNAHGLPPSTRYVLLTALGAAVVAAVVYLGERSRSAGAAILVRERGEAA
jgi:hypothetical protein